MNNPFVGRSVSVINDLSIEERKYLFEKTRVLKDAYTSSDEVILEQYRINHRDVGIYEGVP